MSPVFRRCCENPLLTRADLPDLPPQLVDASSVFNPGAIRHAGKTWLMLRVQSRARETFLMMAHSDDGRCFDVVPELVEIEGLEDVGETLYHVYDPRLTRIEDWIYVVFAADTDTECRLGIARSKDLKRFELVSFDARGDTRNGVLFPERWGGRFLRLERPNRGVEGGPPTGEVVVLSESENLRDWNVVGSVFEGRPRLWDERIGSGPPPIKTKRGWLHIYHGVATHFQSVNLYQAGAVLLDLADPTKVLGRTHANLLEPRELYETVGQVPNVVFPSGMVASEVDDQGFVPDDATLRVYYGAADTVVAAAEATVSDICKHCR